MPKYDLGDWVTWKRIVGIKSKTCSECGQMVYGENLQEIASGKITIVETFRSHKETCVSYNVRLDLGAEVIQVFVPEDCIIARIYK